MKYCGIDLHSNNCVVIVSDEHDRVVYQNRLPNNLGQIAAALEPYRPELTGVVIESGRQLPTSANSHSRFASSCRQWRRQCHRAVAAHDIFSLRTDPRAASLASTMRRSSGDSKDCHIA
jgi:hypothetical protein